jgi:hypothetical protein
MASISAAMPSAARASRIARRLVVKWLAPVKSTAAATVSACAAAAARSRCNWSVLSYSGIGRAKKFRDQSAQRLVPRPPGHGTHDFGQPVLVPGHPSTVSEGG